MEDRVHQKYRRYGNWIYKAVRLLAGTIRFKIADNHKVSENENFIYVFWHQKIFFPTAGIPLGGKKIALVSPSNDGEIMAAVLKNYGYEVIRGSSNDKNIRCLVTMIKKLKQGYNLGLAADGPQGPACKVKPGIIYMAMKTGIKIVPIGGAFKHKYVFKKAWDHFHLPYPFTKGAVVIGESISIPADADQEACMEQINEQINLANDRARALL